MRRPLVPDNDAARSLGLARGLTLDQKSHLSHQPVDQLGLTRDLVAQIVGLAFQMRQSFL